MKKYFQKPFTFFIFEYRICLDIDKYRVSYILFNEDEELEEDLI